MGVYWFCVATLALYVSYSGAVSDSTTVGYWPAERLGGRKPAQIWETDTIELHRPVPLQLDKQILV